MTALCARDWRSEWLFTTQWRHPLPWVLRREAAAGVHEQRLQVLIVQDVVARHIVRTYEPTMSGLFHDEDLRSAAAA